MKALVNKPAEIYGPSQNSIRIISEKTLNVFSNSTVFPENWPLSKKVLSMLHKLTDISNLNDNWNSYGAKSPAKESISASKNFLIEYDRLSLPLYFIAPGVNGEIMIEFKQGEKAAELYFNPDGTTELLLFDIEDEVVKETNLESGLADLINYFDV